MATTTPKIYSNFKLYINSELMAETVSFTLNRMSNSALVETLALGYAGESKGAERVEIHVEVAVPSAGFELNPGKFIQKLDLVQMDLVGASSNFTTKGFIISDTLGQAVNDKTNFSFEFRGVFADFS